MRLLFTTPGYPGIPQADSGSGIGTYVREMTQGLIERGHECHVLTWSKTGESGSSDMYGVQVHWQPRGMWPVLERWWPDGRNLWLRRQAVRRLDRQTPFDWIEIQSDEGLDIGVQRAFPEKTVLRVHTTLKQMMAAKNVPQSPRRRAYLRREAASFRLARRVITHSAAHADALQQVHPELPKPAIVPHGLGSVLLPARRVAPLDQPRFLVVGTLDRRKGTDRLAAVAKAYAGAHGPLELRIISSSPVEGLTQFGLFTEQLPQVTVTYRSDLSPHELEREYHEASALLHLARYESFGLPLIEAAAAGLPVVATRTGVAPDLLNGELSELLVDGDRPGDCVRAMHAAVTANQQLSAAIFRSYQRHFTRAAMVAGFLQVLENWSRGAEAPVQAIQEVQPCIP